MHIDIAAKLRPFSHRFGTVCLIPYTNWEVHVFPVKLLFCNLLTKETQEIHLPLAGPVTQFTVLQDLEKGQIEVWGRASTGYFRYFLTAKNIAFIKGETIPLSFIQPLELPKCSTRLSLGMHKKQDWDLIQRRGMLEEILPFWLRLADFIPFDQDAFMLQKLLQQEPLQLIFQAAFQGIFAPRFGDVHGIGVKNLQTEMGYNPLSLIHAGALQIKKFFFQEEENTWALLPELPKEFHAGRMIEVKTKNQDVLSFEWSKKELKKVIITPIADRVIRLKLQSSLNSFRVRKNFRSQGIRVNRDEILQLLPGQMLYLDRFTH